MTPRRRRARPPLAGVRTAAMRSRRRPMALGSQSRWAASRERRRDATPLRLCLIAPATAPRVSPAMATSLVERSRAGAAPRRPPAPWPLPAPACGWTLPIVVPAAGRCPWETARGVEDFRRQLYPSTGWPAAWVPERVAAAATRWTVDEWKDQVPSSTDPLGYGSQAPSARLQGASAPRSLVESWAWAPGPHRQSRALLRGRIESWAILDQRRRGGSGLRAQISMAHTACGASLALLCTLPRRQPFARRRESWSRIRTSVPWAALLAMFSRARCAPGQ